ncbi:hypothetical protein Acr_07g0014400 [Actinidia rufa]|uniref:F-box associated beta-propeller type 1 domain-containing protein n=1 Tax=Actinidia rufa TaxID=165716 RepID=A0A7J0EXR0_9ERIC|nr:hypothetical protein Acr_07g0014400 [Actinidia rufa]
MMHLNRAIEDPNLNNCRALLNTFPLQFMNYESTDDDDDAIVVHDFPLKSFQTDLSKLKLIPQSAPRNYQSPVIVLLDRCRVPDIRVEVFTLKTNTWRVIQGFKNIHGIYGPGAFMNGALHWLVSPPEGTPAIVSFDLATEILFQEVLPPPCQGFVDFTIQSVGVSGGYLSVLGGDNARMEIWVMKEYGVRESWTK